MFYGNFWGFSSSFMYVIQHCFICGPSDSTMSEDAGIEPRTVATLALRARRSNYLGQPYAKVDLISKPESTLSPVRDLASENVASFLLYFQWLAFSKRRIRNKVPACLWGERIWPGYQHLIAETGSSA